MKNLLQPCPFQRSSCRCCSSQLRLCRKSFLALMTFTRRLFAGLLICLAEPLSKLFAHYITTAASPTDWRLAILCSIHKTLDPEDVFNYHPVRLTPVVCKIFARILQKAILFFLSETRAVSPHQHGFSVSPICWFSRK